MLCYIIENPICGLGNHIITFLNIIYIHFITNNKKKNKKDFKIIIKNNNKLIKKSQTYILFDYNNAKYGEIVENNKLYKQVILGYDIFHLNYFLGSRFKIDSLKIKICFKDYLLLAYNYLNNIWNISSYKLNIYKIKFEEFINNNNINLDKTLFIHIKCSDNIIPEKIINKKYNIYPNWLYLELANIYNFTNICVCSDNPEHPIIKNLENNSPNNVRIINISRFTQNDIMMDFYFMSNSKNILVDNNTFTFISALHFNFNHNNNDNNDNICKNVYFYKDFFSHFLLDIKTKEYKKDIINFCINAFDYNNYSNIILTDNIIVYKNIIFNDNNNENNKNNNFINCNICNNSLFKKNDFLLSNYNINIFDYTRYCKNKQIKISEWKGDEEQLKTLYL